MNYRIDLLFRSRTIKKYSNELLQQSEIIQGAQEEKLVNEVTSSENLCGKD